MRSERDMNLVVRVGPGWVVISGFAGQGHAVHKAPSFGEITEFEGPLQRPAGHGPPGDCLVGDWLVGAHDLTVLDFGGPAGWVGLES